LPMERFTVWNDVEGTEQSVQRAFGGTVAAPVWAQFMEYATRDLPAVDFAPEPVGSDVYRVVPRAVVPDLTGMTYEEMADAVYGEGLRLDRIETASSLPEGTIVAISLRAGTAVQQGTTVSIAVSTGIPEEIPAPNLVGLPLGDVTAALQEFAEDTGVQLGWVVEHLAVTDSRLWGIVIRTEPSAGTPVTTGETINVIVGRESSG
jgi:beta-lactam-binding protein with PASTA domain